MKFFFPVPAANKNAKWKSFCLEPGDYFLEYGVDRIEIHADAIHRDDRVLLIDDLVATGGTANAAIDLIRKSGGEVVAAAFVIDLPDLGGAAKLRQKGVKVHTLVEFEGE